MTKTRKFTLPVIILLTLTRCNTRQEKYYDLNMLQQIDTSLSKYSATSKQIDTSLPKYPFVGEWLYNSSIFYTSELKLRNDGTFKFHDQGCTQQAFTQGRWVKNVAGIVLSSFEAYKPLEEFSQANKSTINRRNEKLKGDSNVKYALIELTLPPVIHIPGPNDTTRIYFDNVQLEMSFNSLFCFDNSSPLGGSKFTRAINTQTFELSPWFDGRGTALPQTH